MEKMNFTVGIIGLGYVGLPLCLAVSKKHTVIGYDINEQVVENLKKLKDETGELTEEALGEFTGKLTNDPNSLKECDLFIVTVPTPVDAQNKPDLTAIVSATKLIASMLRRGTIICYESTVYPGTTEEICVPILEDNSKLVYNVDFFVGYSPERVSPGDSLHTIEKVVKVTSGSTEATADILDYFYQSILSVTTFKASSIRVAEAAKILENTQRDVNIAFMNEMALFFDNLGLRTSDVLAAAKTKWNFLDFKPGLVGGHCISVDPYYLISKADEHNVSLKIVKESRNVNEAVPVIIADKVIENLLKTRGNSVGCAVLILGWAFKENVKDTRNSKVMDIALRLNDHGLKVKIYDPVVGVDIEIPNSSIAITSSFPIDEMFHATIAAVSHDEIKKISMSSIKKIMHENPIIFDLQNIWKKEVITFRL